MLAQVDAASTVDAVGRFLRALNVAFNLDIAKQRLRAAQTRFNRFADTRVDVQIKQWAATPPREKFRRPAATAQVSGRARRRRSLFIAAQVI